PCPRAVSVRCGGVLRGRVRSGLSHPSGSLPDAPQFLPRLEARALLARPHRPLEGLWPNGRRLLRRPPREPGHLLLLAEAPRHPPPGRTRRPPPGRATPPPAPTFAPVRVVPDPTAAVVLPTGLVLRVPVSADPAAVARLVAALGGGPC